MMERVYIELAGLPDVEAIFEIERRCFESDYFSRRQFVYLITRSKGAFYVLKCQGKVVGYLSLLIHARRGNARVYILAVHPDRQGRGLANLLLDKAIEYTREQGLNTLTLEVKTTNETAIRLYKKRGFDIASIKPNYYADGRDAYGMRLSLDIKATPTCLARI